MSINPAAVAPAKLACLKALGIMMSNSLSKSCLCAAAIASKILTHYEIPHRIQTGYTQMPGVAVSTPHVWLESPGGLITDLTFSQPFRAVCVLGQYFNFNEEAIKPYFTSEPENEVPTNTLPLITLSQEAQDLKIYEARAPRHVRLNMADVMEKALNGEKKVTFSGVAAELLGQAHAEVMRAAE
jgi:hypothetical protein